MTHAEVVVRSAATPEAVFAALDDPHVLAGHMARGSWSMGGGAMDLTTDAAGGRAVGSVMTMTGSAFGLRLDLTEAVTARDPPLRKIWQTVGAPSLVVIGGYRMGFEITPASPGSLVRIFIDYEPPASARWLGGLFGGYFARWCLSQMAAAVPAAAPSAAAPGT